LIATPAVLPMSYEWLGWLGGSVEAIEVSEATCLAK